MVRVGVHIVCQRICRHGVDRKRAVDNIKKKHSYRKYRVLGREKIGWSIKSISKAVKNTVIKIKLEKYDELCMRD